MSGAATVSNGSAVLGQPKKMIPIIFVPGVMGTRLWNPRQQEVVWDPDGRWDQVGSFLNALGKKLDIHIKLEPTPHNDALKGEDAVLAQLIEGYAAVSQDSYSAVLKALYKRLPRKIHNGVDVRAFGYDWRQSNAVSGRKLQRLIQHLAQKYDNKVIVVAHSMGGLVARYASKFGSESLIRAMFLIGSPTLGAPESYAMLHEGVNGKLGTVALSTIAYKIPSCYELLPLPRYYLKDRSWLDFEERWTGYEEGRDYHWSQNPDKMFDDTNSPRAIKYLYRDCYTGVGGYRHGGGKHYSKAHLERMARLRSAERFHRQMSERGKLTGRTYIHPYTFLVYSDHHKTTDRCCLRLSNETIVPLAGPIGEVRPIETPSAGDESVPVRSACPRPAHRYLYGRKPKGKKIRLRRCRIRGAHRGLPSTTQCIDTLMIAIEHIISEPS